MHPKLVKGIYKIETNAVFSSIKRGFLLLFPVLMAGALVLLVRDFPIPSFQEFLSQLWGGAVRRFLDSAYTATYGFLSAYLVLSVSFCYSSTFKIKNISLQIMGMFVSSVCFLASFGAAIGSFKLSQLGSTSVFPALLSAILATKLFFVLYERLSKNFHAYAMGVDINYKTAMSAILPLLLCVSAFILVNLIISTLFHVANLNELISQALVALFRNMNGSLGSGVLFTFILNLLWMLGIHGGNALDQVALSVLVPANTDPTQVVSKTFLDNFVLIGGSGAALCLVLAMLFFAKNKNTRGLSRSAAPTALFNINEIVMFGYPVILNPILLIPFLLVPLCSLLIAYTATKIGFIPIINKDVSWTTPVLFSGYIATGTLRGTLVQLVSIFAGTAIYTPFVRLADKMQTETQAFAVDDLNRLFQKNEEKNNPQAYLERGDAVGLAAKSMIRQLRSDIERKNVPIYYQPQVDAHGRIVGGEALLRWRYAGRAIYPPLLIALAKEDGLLGQLTQCILTRACEDTKRFLSAAACPEGFQISANIVAKQLGTLAFIESCVQLVRETQVQGHFCLEVTEESSLQYYETIAAHIAFLRENGITMAIDDFSMGHTSLKYLQNNDFHYVKLDGGLVKEAIENERSQEIISSITALGHSLHFVVVAEYVESEEIRSMMERLGCFCYQGYLFSPAVPADEFLYQLQKNRFAAGTS